MTLLELEMPTDFDFGQTLRGHGWSRLPPFAVDREANVLTYVFAGAELAQPVAATITQSGEKLRIDVAAKKLSAAGKAKILRDVRHILRFDDDLREFYAAARGHADYAVIADLRMGRLLRSPTVFEDLVKTLCTTNCNWAMTEKMTAKLVEKLGAPAADGRRAFPDAHAMAAQSAEFYRDEIRAGYRAEYFAELAQQVAAGVIDPEKWLTSELSTRDLKKEIKRIKGVGDYAADNLLKLLGRYDGLALDSWLRAKFYGRHNGGKVCEDRVIVEHYENFAEWRGLFMWCEMTVPHE